MHHAHPRFSDPSLGPAPGPATPYPLVLVAVELDGLDGGAPTPELVEPVVQGRLGHDDQVRACDAPVLVQVR